MLRLARLNIRFDGCTSSETFGMKKLNRLILCLTSAAFFSSPVLAVEQTDPPLQLSLQEAFELALRHNPLIRSRLALVEQSIGLRTTERSVALPTLQISPASGGLDGPRGSDDAQIFGILLARFSQPIFDMAIPPSWRLGDLQIAVAVHNYWNIVNRVFFGIRNNYIVAYFSPELRSLSERGYQVFEEVGQDLRATAASGISSTLEINRSMYEAVRYRARISSFDTRRRESLNRLAELMGFDLPPDSNWIEKVRLISNPRSQPQPIPYRELVVEAKRNRPDLALFRAAAELQGENARIALAELMPVVTLDVELQSIPEQLAEDNVALELSATGAEGLAAVPTGSSVQNTVFQNEIRFGPAFEWTVFDGFEALGIARSFRSQQKAQQVNADALERQIATGVSMKIKAIAALQTRLDQIESALPVAESTREASQAFMIEDTTPTTFRQFTFSFDERSSLRLQELAILTEQDLALEYSFLDFITGRYIRVSGLEPPVDPRR